MPVSRTTRISSSQAAPASSRAAFLSSLGASRLHS
jgi:hypothetical protein